MLPANANPFLALQEALKGRYSLERELGRGGMGIVYLAREVALNRPVALKLLPPARAARVEDSVRFLREARTVARLSHPNIVPIYAVDQVGGFVFFVMAHVDGQTLGRRIRSRGPLPGDEAARVLHEVACAVEYAHSQGVVHRDLTAGNILIERGSGRVLVTDFGLAEVRTASGLADPEGIEGTPEYMSPEQARGDLADERTDVYALGVIGFYAASGRFPFQGTASEVLRHQVATPAPPLATIAPDVPPALARAVDRCLEKKPRRRFERAGELAEALAGALALRRELAPPLRAFLRRVRDTSQSGAVLSLVGVWALSGCIGALVGGQWGGAAIAAGVLALVLAAPVAFVVPQARRVLKAGFGQADVVDALTTDLERSRDEIAFQVGAAATPTRDLAHRTAYAGLGLFGLGAALGVAGAFGPELALLESLQLEAGSLSAGTATADGLTARLAAAREVADAVDRLLEDRGLS
jgi:serine/threonine-protein kinase